MSDVVLRTWVEAELTLKGIGRKGEEGQGMVEYSLILGLIAAGCVLALTTMGGTIKNTISAITNDIKVAP